MFDFDFDLSAKTCATTAPEEGFFATARGRDFVLFCYAVCSARCVIVHTVCGTTTATTTTTTTTTTTIYYYYY
eukprot:14029146-Heterocapsa_arctica.AAC.1